MVEKLVVGAVSIGLLTGTASAITDEEVEAARAEWRSFCASFEPDYSDGAALLGPAEGHRFTEPFVVVKDGVPTYTNQVFDYSAIEFWVMSRLMWNPDADVERLYKTFCSRAFREAAKPMERFYGTIRERILRGDARIPGGCSTKQLFKLFFPSEVRASLLEDLAEAERGGCPSQEQGTDSSRQAQVS